MCRKISTFVVRLLSVLILLTLLAGAQTGRPVRAASTITVNSLADTVAADGQCTLREAIQNAGNHAATNADCAAGSGGDTINFSVSGTITLGSKLPYMEDAGGLTIDGKGQNVTISGNHTVKVIPGSSLLTLNHLTIANGSDSLGGGVSSSGTLIISNCTFSGNSATSRGGAIEKVVGTLTITNSTFSGNTAPDGGSIYNDSGTVTITDSTFSGNSAPSGYGGGIYNSNGLLTIVNSTFSGNSAYLGRGGAIYKYANALTTVTDSTFSNNSANGGDGGGIYNGTGPLTVTNSIFSGNSATGGFGGGIYQGYPNALNVRGSTFSANSAGSGGGVYNNGYAGYPSAITNSTFSSNSASGDGGGIYSNAGTLTVANSTLSGNSASGSGGGVNRTGGTFTLRNTIVDSNTGGNCSGAITNGGNNIDSSAACGWGFTNSSMSNTNPLLGALAGSPAYFPLNAGSPAIDKGEDSICSVWPVNNESQNGVLRPQGAHCDIGSYELVPPPVPTVTSITLLDPSPTDLASVHFNVVFSASVTGVDTVAPFSDFRLTAAGINGAAITSVSGSGTTYTVTVNTGTGIGTLRLDIVDNDSIKDAGSNPLGGTGVGNGSFAGEAYTISQGASVKIGAQSIGTYPVLPQPSTTINQSSIANGPVRVTSARGGNLFASERVISGSSFNEVMGYPTNQLTTEYWFPWYDNVDMATWILVGNPTSSTAAVDIYIGGVKQASRTIPAGGSITPRFPLQTGPVKVVSTNGVKIFTSERTVYGQDNAFNEVMGYPANQLTTEYWFPWYDNSSMFTWILVGNPSTSTATVNIYIGGKLAGGPYSIPKGGRITPRFNVTPTGPVRVVSTNAVSIFTSERTVAGDSFNEVMGYPTNQLTTEYWYPWYDNVSMNTWVLVGNPTSTTAKVDIYVGSTKTSYTIPAGGRITPRFIGINTGPVRVVSTNGVKIFTSQRALYGTSFNEVMGYPGNKLSTEYWFTWYDSTSMSTDILVGRP
jgi:CSLREA domain-containing protein